MEFRRPEGLVDLRIMTLVIVGLALSCAKQSFPPGGPMDRTPPDVASTYPPRGSTGIDVETAIWIEFNERMDRRSVETSLFISPRPLAAPEYRWKGKKVVVKLPGGLLSDRTYVITIGTDAHDLEGNRLVAPYSFSFSTGDSLDRGRIIGNVIPEEQGKGAFVLAYDLGRNKDPDPVNDLPDYITQISEDLEYSFNNLSNGAYRVFAFRDDDGDGGYTPDKDPLAVPPNDVRISDSTATVKLGTLYLVKRDTTRLRLQSVVAPDRVHVQLFFNKEIDLKEARFFISRPDTLLVVDYYTVPGEKTKVVLLTERQQPGVEYQLMLQDVHDLQGNPLSEERVYWTKFLGSSQEDLVGPSIVSVLPPDGTTDVPLDQPIQITFNEAVRKAIPQSALQFEEPSPPGELSWRDAVTLVFSPVAQWKSEMVYRFSFIPEMIFDYAGNGLSDTLHVEYRTVDEDKLGFITGRVTDADPDARGAFHVRIEQIGGKIVHDLLLLNQGHYSTKGILPGRYRVWAFRDANGNGRLDYGRVDPFVPAERVSFFPDIVAVRARWSTGGIDLKFER
ncbi:MAG TPA: hypothetical protein EYP53_00150 [Candidatus Latescibacteria bacterium]|nr:hypothetical protein [Candidatus Latescibacterota bacterium]